jgi:hypothetical protein
MMSTMAVMLAPGFCRGFYRICGAATTPLCLFPLAIGACSAYRGIPSRKTPIGKSKSPWVLDHCNQQRDAPAFGASLSGVGPVASTSGPVDLAPLRRGLFFSTGPNNRMDAQQENLRRLRRRWPVFAVATIPFGVLAFTAFEPAGAAFFVLFDAILVALAIEQAE